MADIDWPYVLRLFADTDFWWASLRVVLLSVLTWTLGLILGLGIALCKESRLKPVQAAAGTYVWFFRSLPLLVLLIFVYNLPQLWPAAGGVLSNPFLAGLIALVASETAYIAEIHRGGLLGVPAGQHEAGRALGIRFLGRLRLIVVPQAFRIALPSLANEFVTIVKLTSLVSVISLNEILLVGQRLYTQNFKVVDTLIVVALFYVGIVSVFSVLISALERNLDVSRAGKTGAQVDNTASRITEAAPVRRTLPAGAPEVIGISHITKFFGTKQVLHDVSVKVREGEVVSVIGPSGSGKTTLIRTINALQNIDSGEILLDGKAWLSATDGQYRHSADFDARIVEIGMVFQSFNLFPHKTVLENVSLAPHYHRRGNRADIRVRAMEALQKVEMHDHAHKYPHQLSGGQQQRVAIARAIAMRPRVMLFDEPTSALDPELVNEVLRTIEKLAAEGMTMVIVTHEMRFARRISDRIVFMEDGRVVADEAPEALFADKDSRVAAFLNQAAH